MRATGVVSDEDFDSRGDGKTSELDVVGRGTKPLRGVGDGRFCLLVSLSVEVCQTSLQ